MVTKHYVHLGIAVAGPRGLVVPNIKDAQDMSLRELTEALAELTARAQGARCTPADLSGGTFTVTNVGVFGVDAGVPILNPGRPPSWRSVPCSGGPGSSGARSPCATW